MAAFLYEPLKTVACCESRPSKASSTVHITVSITYVNEEETRFNALRLAIDLGNHVGVVIKSLLAMLHNRYFLSLPSPLIIENASKPTHH